jgi:hypothetical protein
MGNANSNSEKGEGLIGFLSEASGKKKHLSKGKSAVKKSASMTKKSKSGECDYSFKIPKGIIDIGKISFEHIPEVDMSTFRKFSSVGKEDYKKPIDYSPPEYSIPDWISYSLDSASENEEIEAVEIKDKSSFLGIKGILMILMVIVLACILANAVVAFLIFLSTPAGRMLSIMAVLVIYFWMKKKGWLPL